MKARKKHRKNLRQTCAKPQPLKLIFSMVATRDNYLVNPVDPDLNEVIVRHLTLEVLAYDCDLVARGNDPLINRFGCRIRLLKF